ncbi:Sensory transduction protein regX3 [compost metagenome]
MDWNLPDRSGLEVLAWARTNLKPPPPMLLVTSRAEDEDIVAGLNAGADDYLPKPLSAAVLEARINALMRRAYAQPSTPGAEVHGDTVFHDSAGAVTRNAKTVVLTAKEYALAQLLFRNLHRALSRTYILETVWGNEPNLNSRSLDMHISRIRTKLELRPEQGFRLTPIYSYGYRLERVGEDSLASSDAQTLGQDA